MNNQFDPMTGERVTTNDTQSSNNEPAGKKKKGWIFALIAIILVIAVGAVTAAVKSGVFSSDSAKVVAAITNTLNDTDYLTETLKMGSLFVSDELTVSMNSEAEGYGMELQFLSGKTQKQMLGSVDVPGFTTVDFQAELTEEELKVQVSELSDYIFTYNYTQTKSSYMQEVFGYQLDSFDEMLKILHSAEREPEYNSELIKTILAEGKKLEFEKAASEEFEVDKQNRKCKAISTTITIDSIQNIMDEIEAVCQESWNQTYGYQGYAGDIEDYFDEIEEELADMEDFHVTFFIYKNKLACVRIEEEQEELELRFLGGDTRMQNMQVLIDGEEILRMEGENVESTEVRTFFVEGEEMMCLEYDRKSGDLDIDADEGRTLISGKIAQDKDGFGVSLDKLMIDGQFVNLKYSVSVKKGASFKEFEGREFDLSQATVMSSSIPIYIFHP